MTATPLLMPRRKSALVPATSLAYSTSTGDKPRQPLAVEAPSDPDYVYCFVCSRCTDHWGEHDALVDAGLASYDADGTVRRTSGWDADKAKVIADQEFAAYCAKVGLEP